MNKRIIVALLAMPLLGCGLSAVRRQADSNSHRIDGVSTKLDRVERRLSNVRDTADAIYEEVEDRNSLENRWNICPRQLRERLENIEKRLQSLEGRNFSVYATTTSVNATVQKAMKKHLRDLGETTQ